MPYYQAEGLMLVTEEAVESILLAAISKPVSNREAKGTGQPRFTAGRLERVRHAAADAEEGSMPIYVPYLVLLRLA